MKTTYLVLDESNGNSTWVKSSNWEREVGDVMEIDNRHWRIVSIHDTMREAKNSHVDTHNEIVDEMYQRLLAQGKNVRIRSRKY